MKLKTGITGLRNSKDTPVESSSDVTKFKASIHPIEYGGDYKIDGYKKEIGYTNYYRIAVTDKFNKELFDILVNSIYPYYCGVTPESGCLNHEFVELPPEVLNCADSDFQYLSTAELNAPYKQTDLEELYETEIKEINYWRPQKIGNIIFNGYD